MQQWFSIFYNLVPYNQYSPAATGNDSSPSDEDGNGVAIGNDTSTDDIIEEDDWVAIGYTPTDNIIEEGITISPNMVLWFEFLNITMQR